MRTTKTKMTIKQLGENCGCKECGSTDIAIHKYKEGVQLLYCNNCNKPTTLLKVLTEKELEILKRNSTSTI